MKRRRAVAMSITAALLAAAGPALADRQPRAHLTINVDGPVLHDGGTVLVMATPISKADWDKLPTLPAAPRFPDNPKAKEMAPGDKLFEVTSVSASVTIIEFVYLEGGTFGFNLVVAEDGTHSSALRSRRILTGSGYYTDRRTGKRIDWPDVSTIHLYGPAVDEARSRLVRASASDIMNAYPPKTVASGVTVYVPTANQLQRALLKELR